MLDWATGREEYVHCSSRAIAQSNQDGADGDGCEAEPDSHSLQWPKPTPPTSANEIHSHDPQDSQQAKRDDQDAQLTFGYHGAHIIAQRCEGATLGPNVRIWR